MAARYYEVVNNFDVRELLPRVQVPTLVMHVRDDVIVPIEAGRQMAAGIPGARFIVRPARNYLRRDQSVFDQVMTFADLVQRCRGWVPSRT